MVQHSPDSTYPNSPHTLSSDEHKRLQFVLLEMLIEVDRICKKHGIKYSLAMGTLLGAVRHRGFIPWDDDLDVAMLRPEYEKFKTACARELDSSRFFLQNHLTDAHYRWGYGRIRRLDSEFVRVGQEHLKMRTGIFLDVFPFDAVPDGLFSRGIHRLYCLVLRKLLYAEVGWRSAPTRALRTWYRLLNVVPRRWTLGRLDRLTRHQRETELVRVLTFPVQKRGSSGYRRRWFEDLTEFEFEGGLFPGTRDYHHLLRFSYGEYMLLPPPELRVCCHPAAKFVLPVSPASRGRPR